MTTTPVLIFEYLSAPIDRRALPARIVDEWANTLILARERIIASLSRFLDPNVGQANFLNQIADASSDAWEAFVNPNWVGAELIKLKQRIKLAGAYPSWKANITDAYTNANITYAGKTITKFEYGVLSNKGKFEKNVTVTIGGVGFKPEGWGPVAKLALLLLGDLRVPRYITANEQLTLGSGWPDSAFKTIGRPVIPSVISTYVQGIVYLIYLKESGYDSTIRADVIKTFNDRLAKIAGLADKGYSVTLELRATAEGLPQVYGKVEKVAS
jgi:hypothetical protein